MSENYTNPVDHGVVGSAGITARETVKGGVGGVFGGAVRGGLWGALIAGGTTALGIAAVGAAVVGSWGLLASGFSGLGALSAVAATSGVIGWVAGIGGLVTGAAGLAGGALLGAPVGALTGTVTGFSQGREVVNHDRGAARVMETVRQQNETMAQTAMAQMATANALRAEVIRQASAAPQPVLVATPGPHVIYTAQAQHQGVGMRPAQAAMEAGPKTHVQRAAEAVAQAAATQQMQ